MCGSTQILLRVQRHALKTFANMLGSLVSHSLASHNGYIIETAAPNNNSVDRSGGNRLLRRLGLFQRTLEIPH